jgi:hypothetical protein
VHDILILTTKQPIKRQREFELRIVDLLFQEASKELISLDHIRRKDIVGWMTTVEYVSSDICEYVAVTEVLGGEVFRGEPVHVDCREAVFDFCEEELELLFHDGGDTGGEISCWSGCAQEWLDSFEVAVEGRRVVDDIRPNDLKLSETEQISKRTNKVAPNVEAFEEALLDQSGNEADLFLLQIGILFVIEDQTHELEDDDGDNRRVDLVFQPLPDKSDGLGVNKRDLLVLDKDEFEQGGNQLEILGTNVAD